MRTPAIVMVFLSLAAPLVGQVSHAGFFLGEVPSGKIMVSVQGGQAAVYHFDTVNGFVDSSLLPLNGGTQGSGSSLSGKTVSVAVSSSAATGKVGDVVFNAPREPITGLYSYAGYSGTLTINGVSNNLLLMVMPSGAVILYYFTPVNGQLLTGGGVGTINGANIVTVPTVSGQTATLAFNPTNGGAGGAMTIGASSYQYFLLEARRPRMVNVSTRGRIGGGKSLIAGFVATQGSKTYLLRGVGPGLLAAGVADANLDPAFTVYRNGVAIAANDNWELDARVAEARLVAPQVGAGPLGAGSKDASMVLTLDAGAYTVVLTGAGEEGDGIVEVYEVN